jgi:hypothetical protein
MKFKIFGRMQSCPAIKLDTRINPLDFSVDLRGAFKGELGPFAAHIGEIPIRLAIPFLRRKHIIASIGGFPIALNRFQVNVDEAALVLNGVLGLKGIHALIDTQVDCSTDVNLKGDVTGRIGLSHLDLNDNGDDDDEHY